MLEKRWYSSANKKIVNQNQQLLQISLFLILVHTVEKKILKRFIEF